MASEYPLILAIRVRADQESQKKLASMLLKVFGSKLCSKGDSPSEPTPDSLKGRILLEISGRSNDDFSLGSQSGLPMATPLIDELECLNFFASEIITGIPQGKGPFDMSVMPETVASRVATSNSDVLVEAGESQIIRVEPNDSRVDCSNYNPLGMFIYIVYIQYMLQMCGIWEYKWHLFIFKRLVL